MTLQERKINLIRILENSNDERLISGIEIFLSTFQRATSKNTFLSSPIEQIGEFKLLDLDF